MKLQGKDVCKKCRATCCYFGGPTFDKKEKEKILNAGYKDYCIPCHEYFDFKIKKGKCPYLKNYSCSIYKVRPVSCKIWPVFGLIKNGKIKYVVFSCPIAPHMSKKEIKKAAKVAKKLPKRFYELSWEGMKPAEIKKMFRFKPVPLNEWLKKMK